jgi:hypothetical protein
MFGIGATGGSIHGDVQDARRGDRKAIAIGQAGPIIGGFQVVIAVRVVQDGP